LTPAARYGAAIEILDAMGADGAAEQHLSRWARGARYAGSKDRAAVRDIVFDVQRRRASSAWLGGAETGSALVLGLLRGQGLDLQEVFTGHGHAPAPLEPDEIPSAKLEDAPRAVQLDVPEWALSALEAAQGAAAEDIAKTLRDRAPVGLRTALRHGTRDELIATLAALGHTAVPHDAAPTALVLPTGTRGLHLTEPFLTGGFEFQDPGSQGLIARCPVQNGARILDYCAGGGGKALALADAYHIEITAHDADPGRMRDLPERARRAGVSIEMVGDVPTGARFDGIICDVPCSGSGAWRRAPEARWQMSPERLEALCTTQGQIVDTCVGLLAPGGWLAYMTCSLFDAENGDQTAAILARHPHLTAETTWSTTPLNGTDGFYLQVFRAPI
jgi:16S rRNA (cytosine967-C5)-methyltransferase